MSKDKIAQIEKAFEELTDAEKRAVVARMAEITRMDEETRAEYRRLEAELKEGLADIAEGRIASAEEVFREVDEIIAEASKRQAA